MPFIGNKPTALPLSSNDLEDNIISTAKIQDNAVTAAKYIEPVPFRNIIINGDMSIAQRGTSQASAGSSGGSYQTLDRWKFFNNNQGAFTWSQDTDVPTGQGFANSMKFDCTTADASPSSGDYLVIQQPFEGQNLQYLKKGTSNATSLTLSFWVKSVKTGTFIVDLVDVDNSRQISKSYTIDSASTWEKKTLTFAGDTTGAFDNDNAKSLEFNFWLGAGTDFTSGTLATSWEAQTNANRAVGQVNLADSTDNNFWITGVQLEAGTTASDFEFLPHDVNLQRCQRYCQVLTEANTAPDVYVSLGDNINGVGGRFFQVNFPTTMRTACSTSFSSASHFETVIYETGWTDCSTIASAKGGTTSMVIETTGSNNDSRGLGTALRIENASGQITFSAEL